MTRRTVQTLVGVIAGLLLLLVVLRGGDDKPAVSERELLLPGFASAANQIVDVRIVGSGEDGAITLQKQDEAWVVANRDNYPADIGQLRKLVVALAEGRIIEEKTSNPGNYDKLGVSDPDEDGKGTKVIARTPDESFTVIFGNRAQGDWHYARNTATRTSVLVNQDPDLPADASDWLHPEIVDVASTEVRKVVIAHAGGDRIEIGKEEQAQTDFDVAGIPEGRELSYPTVANGIAGALSKLELDDVRRHVESTPSTTTTFETWDGLQLIVDVVSDGDESWISIRAETDSDDAGVTEQAATINARVAGWQYRIPEYKKNLLVRRWDDILKA